MGKRGYLETVYFEVGHDGRRRDKLWPFSKSERMHMINPALFVGVTAELQQTQTRLC